MVYARSAIFSLAYYLVALHIIQSSMVLSERRQRREDREKKASLVRKLMRLNPKDGSIRLVNGANEHEGKLVEGIYLKKNVILK